MNPPALIVFDLDGTLVDSAPDLAYAADTMLARLGLPARGVEAVRGWIGNGVPMLVKRALTGEMWPEGEPERFDQALPLFMEIYAAHVCDRGGLFPGVLEGVAELKRQGYKLAVLTNKHSKFTLPLLEQLGVAAYMDYIGCGDQFDKHKPHPEPLLKTAERFGVRPEQCLMVGDSTNDVQAARAAGYGILVVPYGYRSCERVEDLGADGVIDSIAQLPALLRRAA
ncbi:phosphoglycolate phosphatase [Methylogaea oryzae]|uniref:Phosphoglycolate phosphatase n=2 Tax=Methylogaea oryzae TaxID=1295382 RepID=A0A8D4VKJ0_9GAMM|nr:phosphoglycolate phosphatase [Methylogaea oryzae]BBL69513.1 phosphoglycolate phosphatase 1 [Methylogaea oryzae]